jgi:DNA (cytosine-5)-methyltransferase 1
MTKLRILDLFCKAGGAGMGYYMAGFDVTGVDIEPQPHYPFAFVQGDAIEYVKNHGHEFDVIHASPPCQFHSVTKFSTKTTHHLDLIPPTREALIATGKPYVIENVEGATKEMIDPARYCGSHFGLRVQRHRMFETNWGLEGVPCSHAWQLKEPRPYVVRMGKSRGGSRSAGTVPVFGHSQLLFDGKTSIRLETIEARKAMGISWMTKPELNQAIPPAYTHLIGFHLLNTMRDES